MLMRAIPYIITMLVSVATVLLILSPTVPSVAVDEPEGTTASSANPVEPTVDTTPTEATTPTEPTTPEEEWVEYIATAYCPCEKCCGVWATRRPLDENGDPIVYGATGIILRQGISVAADVMHPMGTMLAIEGMGTYIVQDRGGAIKGNRLDIYFTDHDEASDFGVQTVRVRVVN
jgi:3D (Asp-Asp-Asp) domain-containing protein